MFEPFPDKTAASTSENDEQLRVRQTETLANILETPIDLSQLADWNES